MAKIKWVSIKGVMYPHSKIPRRCEHCGFWFPGLLTAKGCSDICRDVLKAKRLEEKKEEAAAKELAKKRREVTQSVRREKAVKEKAEKPVKVRKTDKICMEPTCGKPFRAKRSTQKCCSTACGNKLVADSRKVEKICINCGQPFKVAKSLAQRLKCCSKKCRMEVNAKTKVWMKCKTCGKDFEVYKNRVELGLGRYCSHSCRSKGARINDEGKYLEVDKGDIEVLVCGI